LAFTAAPLFHHAGEPCRFAPQEEEMSKAPRFVKTAALYLLAGGIAGLFLAVPPALAEDQAAKAVLTAADCVKCHQKEPQEIAANGAAHKTQIGCQDCHAGHRPSVANNIPECSNCHSGEAHYQIKGCVSCHNPHSPLDIALKGELKEVCLTCHADQGKELVASPSKHAEVSCNFCHADKHGNIPVCTDCHQPHSDKMTQADCKSCHQAHMPLTLTYGASVPSTQCAACHGQAFGLLQASPTKHRDIACVTCHADKHKTVPQCSDCHGLPHAEGMHQRFPKCGECHNIAHDLNNFPAKQEGKGAKEGKTKPGAKK
jgi:predicted CXXCH cytochrome family protein